MSIPLSREHSQWVYRTQCQGCGDLTPDPLQYWPCRVCGAPLYAAPQVVVRLVVDRPTWRHPFTLTRCHWETRDHRVLAAWSEWRMPKIFGS